MKEESPLREHQARAVEKLHPYSPYRNMVVLHPPGSGKTRIAAEIAVRFWRSCGTVRVRVLGPRPAVVASTRRMLEETIAAISPEAAEAITVTATTYGLFAAALVRRMQDKEHVLVGRYARTLTIFDEAHALSGSSRYITIWSYLRWCEQAGNIGVVGARALFLSGSVYRNSLDDLVSIVNLAVPMNMQLPRAETLPPAVPAAIGEITKHHRSTLAAYVHCAGPIEHAALPVTYRTESGVLSSTPATYISTMSSQHTQEYMRLFESAAGGAEPAAVYTRLRQRSLAPSAIGWGNGCGVYSRIVAEISQLPRGTRAFVYLPYVSAPGIDTFCTVLERQLQLQPWSENAKPTAKMYLVVSGATTPKALEWLRAANAEPCCMLRTLVVIGSRVASEALAVRNVSQVHIAQPCWTYAETEQALRRASRPGAHDPEAMRAINRVDVYLHASVPLPYASGVCHAEQPGFGLAVPIMPPADADATLEPKEAEAAVGNMGEIRFSHRCSIDLYVHSVMMRKRAGALAVHKALLQAQ